MDEKIRLTRIGAQMGFNDQLQLIASFSNGFHLACAVRDAADPHEVGDALRKLGAMIERNPMLKDSGDPAPGPHGYGWCPICRAPGLMRERRPHGYVTCTNKHAYPSAHALQTLPGA